MIDQWIKENKIIYCVPIEVIEESYYLYLYTDERNNVTEFCLNKGKSTKDKNETKKYFKNYIIDRFTVAVKLASKMRLEQNMNLMIYEYHPK